MWFQDGGAAGDEIVCAADGGGDEAGSQVGPVPAGVVDIQMEQALKGGLKGEDAADISVIPAVIFNILYHQILEMARETGMISARSGGAGGCVQGV